jgi:hypothetical protein
MFMASNAESKISTDHEEIRAWAEARGGQPACVKGTGKEGDVGLLRLDFPGFSGADSLQHITWEEFFEKFDDQGLALLHQEQTAGGAQSNFNKLISRETAAAAEKKAGSKKTGSKKVTANKSPAKKAPAKKVAAKKTPAKKGVAKKIAVKKAVVKKAAGKKSPAKKAPAKKAAKKTGRR